MSGRRALPAWVARGLLPVLLIGLAGLLAGCSGEDRGSLPDDAPSAAADQRLEVVEGEPFGFGGLTVADGWTFQEQEGMVAMEATTLVGAQGNVTNDGDEAAPALFELVMVDGDQAAATVRCSSEEIAPGESASLRCLPTEQMPDGYDRVVVQAITR